MKHTTLNAIGALLISTAPLTLTTASAQAPETAAGAIISTEGTISESGPQLLVIRNETATAPLRYTSGSATTYVDEQGQPVSVTTLKSGVPVTVYAIKVGEAMVASKVMVRKVIALDPARAPLSAAVTAGTISETSNTGMVIKPDPVRYIYSPTTIYVDEAGRPVFASMLKPGLPVTVHATRVGDRVVATKVIIRGLTASTPAPSGVIPAPTVETKKTTTTTTGEK